MANNLNWFPGHMRATINKLKLTMKVIDVGVIIIDSRLANTSLKRELLDIFVGKPIIVLFNKSDLADKLVTNKWIEYLQKKNIFAIEIEAKTRSTLNFLTSFIEQKILKDKIIKAKAKGVNLTPYKIGVIGIPNSGKSTFINTLVGSKKCITKNMPGVTRELSWNKVSDKLLLLDTPGLLWPKLTTDEGYHLAITGAIPQKLLDPVEIAVYLINFLIKYYPNYLKDAYNISSNSLSSLDILSEIAFSLGCLKKGGLPDIELASKKLLKNLENPKYGVISLERVPDDK